jgi:hypothetical protein
MNFSVSRVLQDRRSDKAHSANTDVPSLQWIERSRPGRGRAMHRPRSGNSRRRDERGLPPLSAERLPQRGHIVLPGRLGGSSAEAGRLDGWAGGALRLYRGLRQPAATALGAGLGQSGRVREGSTAEAGGVVQPSTEAGQVQRRPPGRAFGGRRAATAAPWKCGSVSPGPWSVRSRARLGRYGECSVGARLAARPERLLKHRGLDRGSGRDGLAQ